MPRPPAAQLGFSWAEVPRAPRHASPPRATSPAVAAPGVQPFTFYLGVHKPYWLFDAAMRGVPLFLSYRQLRELQDRRALKPAVTEWCLDSGGFMELAEKGRWTYSAKSYADGVRRFARECGGLRWAAIMDWMTEACVLEKTGGTVAEHQARTIDSLIELRSIAPEIPWAPVLQGWGWGEHEDHVEQYARRGIDLTREPIVGVGSICRRSTTMFATMVLNDLADYGLKLHAFGFKIDGLTSSWSTVHPFGVRRERPVIERDTVFMPLWMRLRSADSTAWSFNARRSPPLPGCTHEHCNNCQLYARQWRQELMQQLATTGADAVRSQCRGTRVVGN